LLKASKFINILTGFYFKIKTELANYNCCLRR
jgi:hypothetical protein